MRKTKDELRMIKICEELDRVKSLYKEREELAQALHKKGKTIIKTKSGSIQIKDNFDRNTIIAFANRWDVKFKKGA